MIHKLLITANILSRLWTVLSQNEKRLEIHVHDMNILSPCTSLAYFAKSGK